LTVLAASFLGLGDFKTSIGPVAVCAVPSWPPRIDGVAQS
jgi:hypothetical protein